MNLHAELPPGDAQRLSKLITGDEQILYCLASDLTLDRQFGPCYLLITSAKLIVLDPVRPALALEFRDVKEIRLDELFGSGRLAARLRDEPGERTLIYYTQAFVPEFAAASRLLNDRLNHRPGKEPEEEQEAAYCPVCKTPLPERGASCLMCMRRLKVFQRLVALIRPHKVKALFLVAMTFLAVGSQMGPPYITKMIVDDVLTHGHYDRLHLWIGLMLACGLGFLIARVVAGGLTSWLGARVVSDLRSRLHAVLQRQRMTYFNRRDSGEIIGRVMHDTEDLQHFLIDGLPYVLVQSVSFVAIAAILMSLDHKLALLVFLPIPLLLSGGRWFWVTLVPLFHKHSYRIGALHSMLSESIHGIKTIKAFATESKRATQFTNASERLFSIRFILERTFIGFTEGMYWVMSLGVVAVWFFAARRIAHHDPNLTLGTLLAFVGYIWLFYGPLQWFTAILNWMTRAFSGAERIFAVLDSKEETHDVHDAVALPRMEGAISFNDVYYSYERGKEVIKGVSFEIEPGEMIGLVGKSGAGKSTLISLMCRFYDADSGLIRIDGHPIKKIRLDSLRRQIGMVLQDPFLFNASILDNIRYGWQEAPFDEVVRAAKAANAHDFILDKEDGYDTLIGERGAQLSGGEKQRISIARAILHDPSLLILDEATSSVDTETEREIQEAIRNLIQGRTTIAIAHRLSTLRNANRLIVIDEGQIAEIGTHDELLSKKGIYARLAQIQSELNKLRGEVWA